MGEHRFWILDWNSGRIIGWMDLRGTCATLRVLSQLSDKASFDVMRADDKTIVSGHFVVDDGGIWSYSPPPIAEMEYPPRFDPPRPSGSSP